jgi:hypothetical protein
MNGFTWQHVLTIAIGATVATAGAIFAPAAAATALIAGGFGIATAAAGHAQGSKEKKE